MTNNMTKEDAGLITGDIDYAILKSVAMKIKTIHDISTVIQIRTIVIEKHMYELVKKGFINFQFDYFVITLKGNEEINNFETSHSEEEWKPISKFITSTLKQQKEQKLRTYKIIDVILVILMLILFILVIYFGFIT